MAKLAALPKEFAPARLKQRRENANTERMAFQPLLGEAFQYGIPYRKSTRSGPAGEKRVDQVYDHTAIDASTRFAGKIQQDLWPAGQQNFELEPGAILQIQAENDAAAKTQLDDTIKQLSAVSTVCQAFFDGVWDTAFHEVMWELSAGTGCMLMNPPDEYDDRLWNSLSVPIDEVTLEGGPNNQVSGIFWLRKMSVRVLMETWPRGNYSKTITDIAADAKACEEPR